MLIVQLHCCQCVSNLDINLGIAYYMLLCVHAQNVFCQKESADIASLSFDLSHCVQNGLIGTKRLTFLK